MPSIKVSSAFLVGLCVDRGRLFKDHELCAVYDLPEDVFQQKSIKGVQDRHVEALQDFIIAALSKADGERRTAFICGDFRKESFMDNNHNIGRGAYEMWFRTLKLSSKIHGLVEGALQDNGAHPKQLLSDQPFLDEADEDMPAAKNIYTNVEKPIAQAVFGQNAITSVVVASGMATAINAILHHGWERLRKERKRAKATKDALKTRVQDMMTSE
jgi:hypothetical protein